MNLDKDLQAVQEVRSLCAKAKAAQQEFRNFSQDQVDRVVAAMADAGFQAAEKLARSAVDETGYGNVADKTKKNQFCTRDLYQSLKHTPTVGIIREDRKNKILEVAEPFGVVAAIIPTTNPTSTAMFKSIISLKARNGIVISPHPRAVRCIKEAATVVREAAVSAGAPEGLIGSLPISTLPATHELMHHPDVNLILATGGSGLVRAAYSSGKPAYGVGPGNVPVYLHKSADVRKAVADVVAGKTFDYGTLCSSEQALIVDSSVIDDVKQFLIADGAHFLSADEMKMLQQVLFTSKLLVNPEMVGKAPQVLAKKAGFSVPEPTKLLVAELDGVGKAYPLSAEKLSPTLVLLEVTGPEEGIQTAVEVLNFGGRGHTAAIHAKNDKVIRQYGLSVPAFRVVVNSAASIGAVGYTNNLMPSMTLGCGSFGHNITSDNITAQHLMNIKRVAYETKPLAHARNGATWRTNFDKDHSRSKAPYTKALASSVSRKGSRQSSDGIPQRDAIAKAAPPKVFGESGMSESEVEQVVDEFLKNRSKLE